MVTLMDAAGNETMTLSVGSDDENCTYEYANPDPLSMEDEVPSNIAIADDPMVMIANAAIAQAKKRKRAHSFETNPSIRKRHRNRLLRKLRKTIDEFATRGGQQAVVLVTIPGKPETSFKCFGAKPLEDVVKKLRIMIMSDLESALTQHAPPPVQTDPSLFELPPLTIDGIPTPVEKMTQAQLRAFIPLMLKYSTGRGKPGWGRESTKPPWWPSELPWANIRIDARCEDDKQRISWTHALRQIVINCYKFHGRDDLLPSIPDDDEDKHQIHNTETVLKYHSSVDKHSDDNMQTQLVSTEQYASTVLQTISNPDGTVSIIQVDPNNPFITLPDGTTAQVQGLATIHTGQDDVHAVQALTENSQGETVVVDLNNVTENPEGGHQLILTDENGRSHSLSISGTVSVPVSASMYQTMMANIQQIQTQEDGTIQVVTPVIQLPKMDGDENQTNGTQVATTHQIVMSNNGEPQVLQVLSIKDDSSAQKQ
ncbi:hypothetical protein GE061_007318 [Apolygus lucorum]|uniref:Nuclear respiratory factor 1 NLS/DNA-binding dimerisation domain-containing protein n=1 Tax=Apolygus lucorum TaxID=248454 RepID=A0A8S9WRD7_APOLU|nr:hypothetical protein GE061_007318 [Apolygus lucorum]